jgi:hypothetical protein
MDENNIVTWCALSIEYCVTRVDKDARSARNRDDQVTQAAAAPPQATARIYFLLVEADPELDPEVEFGAGRPSLASANAARSFSKSDFDPLNRFDMVAKNSDGTPFSATDTVTFVDP